MGNEVLILLAIAGAWWLLKPGQRRELEPQRPKRRAKHFPAASIRYENDACGAVKDLDNVRFLAWEAPSLPLQQCDAASCNCRYAHFHDRRQLRPDRRDRLEDDSDVLQVVANFDRRRQMERRADAKAMARPLASEAQRTALQADEAAGKSL